MIWKDRKQDPIIMEYRSKNYKFEKQNWLYKIEMLQNW